MWPGLTGVLSAKLILASARAMLCGAPSMCSSCSTSFMDIRSRWTQKARSAKRQVPARCAGPFVCYIYNLLNLWAVDNCTVDCHPAHQVRRRHEMKRGRDSLHGFHCQLFRASMQVKELWAGATSRYESALAQVLHAITLAEQELAQQTAVRLLHESSSPATFAHTNL